MKKTKQLIAHEADPPNGRMPPGLRCNGSAATSRIPIPDQVVQSPIMAHRLGLRLMERDRFIEYKGSGTLRRSQRMGMNVTSHYLHERAAYEFGYPFEACPERFVTWGEPRSEGDCKAITEAGWHVERYADMCLFPGDEMECKWITVEQNGERREGIGIIMRKTSAPWLPPGYIIFCIIAEYDRAREDFLPAVNPC